jgi:hypothetical protein
MNKCDHCLTENVKVRPLKCTLRGKYVMTLRFCYSCVPKQQKRKAE